jgi:hypothetical protein
MTNLVNKDSRFLVNRLDCYPPHHRGDHLEEHFIKFWEAEGHSSRKLIPVHWTAVYNAHNRTLREELKLYLKSLDPNDRYFVVCTHDDAPVEDLPPDTIVFGAGGNSERINIPIPLTCSAHGDPGDFIRTIPMSFVGSMTHPIRQSMESILLGNPDVFLSTSQWSVEVPSDRVDLFKRVTQRSIFSLCPRGYGATSYRLYESMQLGAIPVYVSDKHLLPWSDELDWSQFSILVKPHEIDNIVQMALGESASKVRKMQDKLYSTWVDYFSIESTCKHIARRAK